MVSDREVINKTFHGSVSLNAYYTAQFWKPSVLEWLMAKKQAMVCIVMSPWVMYLLGINLLLYTIKAMS